MQYEFISSQESDSEERGGRGGGASPSPPVPDLPVLDDVDALGGRGGGASVPRGSSSTLRLEFKLEMCLVGGRACETLPEPEPNELLQQVWTLPKKL